MRTYRIVLASGSPRRKELLALVGAEFTCRTSSREEVIRSRHPAEVVAELSEAKAEDVCAGEEGPVLVLGADTVVAQGGNILGKPKDAEDAETMLSLLSGKTHQVYTGVTVLVKEADGSCRRIAFVEETTVEVYPLSKEEIRAYVATGEPMDKAGAYAVQGKFAKYIRRIDGDYYNIVGLPIAGLVWRLKAEGIALSGGRKQP